MPLDQRGREQMNKLQQRYLARRKQINADTRLSATGKERALGKLYRATVQKRDEIVAAGEQAHGARTTLLERKMASINSADPMLMMAYREALSTVAENVQTPADASTLMNRALQTGDTTLAKAVFVRSFNAIPGEKFKGWKEMWVEVVNSYLNENPAVRPYAAELADLRDLDSRQNRFAESALTSIQRPPELQRYSDADLAQMEREDLALSDGGEVA